MTADDLGRTDASDASGELNPDDRGSHDPSDPHRMRSATVPPVSKLWWGVGPLAAIAVVVVVALVVRAAPYVVFVPGSATAVEPLITVKSNGGEVPKLDEVNGTIFYTTVSVEFPNGALVLYRTQDDKAEIAPEDQYLGTQSKEQNRRYGLAQMTSAKDKATKVALESLGYPVKVTDDGAVLVDVDPNFPASKVLMPGDTIVAADGEPIRTSDELGEAIQSHKPGDKIEFRLIRLNQPGEMTVTAPTIENAKKPGQAQLGVSIETRPRFTFPFEVEIDSGDVGGPSAGLAFTLALIDRLSVGDLTGGKKVAVTGTIELDGSVGEVGGVPQKTGAAIAEGAEYFLVPPGEYQQAIDAADGKLQVVKVSSVDEALAALKKLGGDPVQKPADGG